MKGRMGRPVLVNTSSGKTGMSEACDSGEGHDCWDLGLSVGDGRPSTVSGVNGSP